MADVLTGRLRMGSPISDRKDIETPRFVSQFRALAAAMAFARTLSGKTSLKNSHVTGPKLWQPSDRA